jgi:ABC-type multidrug transport system fused ATPase/permease subunit
LKSVDLQIRPSSKSAVIGDNGAGKTTIINLILGFYMPNQGRLMADDIPYKEIDMIHLRKSIGVVSQQPPLFSGTIKENISYGVPDIGIEQVLAASENSLAHDFITQLPDGYETKIGEDGTLLSGGECQRIAIARALLRRPKLLILDEPTNHLDRASVSELMNGLNNLKERPALLIVSHDMSVVSHADEVFKLENGIISRCSV